ncbi:hypothetical protein IID10_12600 [candidate division KSB1 bacterium]|nr:hypothetical protein [candidate division KSB1 bacterium]
MQSFINTTGTKEQSGKKKKLKKQQAQWAKAHPFNGYILSSTKAYTAPHNASDAIHSKYF